jgi:hypothetical protein
MKKFVPDHLGVVDAEKVFITTAAGVELPECYANLGTVLKALEQARAEGSEAKLRALSRSRWTAIQAVRAHGPSGIPEVDEALAVMELAAEEAGEAKRRR